ncbi:DUF983 domain-containing protein [Pontixanthobacter aestiaquae]|uniref:DUF983 domain-containing protein n=1 Tax=Pontixanthobacter aestiaquae TaxID=1509367 RepID=A0A844Z399_9SPHN|nr:DUF983 domain-containing protein [Pontixanthobacter aestiaquae]MDN3645834.1 DUF983 domain-containing protein [Pontixanthobacter aestiaquae]MXO83171.1 DUF983 domain-containing protein [Pontixanthobacter aestiaquae]
MTTDKHQTKGQPGIAAAALFGLCPKCAERTLFDGIATFAPKCTSCELDYSKFNVGDGPAGFLTLIIGALIVGLALWLEVSVTPPFWIHAMLWVPLTVAAVFFGLRAAKAALLYAEYNNDAGEAGLKK